MIVNKLPWHEHQIQPNVASCHTPHQPLDQRQRGGMKHRFLVVKQFPSHPVVQVLLLVLMSMRVRTKTPSVLRRRRGMTLSQVRPENYVSCDTHRSDQDLLLNKHLYSKSQTAAYSI